MSIAHAEQSALASPHRYRQAITNVMVSVALVFAAGVAGVAPTSSDRNPVGTDSNPFTS